MRLSVRVDTTEDTVRLFTRLKALKFRWRGRPIEDIECAVRELHSDYVTIDLWHKSVGFGMNGLETGLNKFLSECDRFRKIRGKIGEWRCVVTPDLTFIGCQTFKSDSILKISDILKKAAAKKAKATKPPQTPLPMAY